MIRSSLYSKRGGGTVDKLTFPAFCKPISATSIVLDHKRDRSQLKKLEMPNMLNSALPLYEV